MRSSNEFIWCLRQTLPASKRRAQHRGDWRVTVINSTTGESEPTGGGRAYEILKEQRKGRSSVWPMHLYLPYDPYILKIVFISANTGHHIQRLANQTGL